MKIIRIILSCLIGIFSLLFMIMFAVAAIGRQAYPDASNLPVLYYWTTLPGYIWPSSTTAGDRWLDFRDEYKIIYHDTLGTLYVPIVSLGRRVADDPETETRYYSFWTYGNHLGWSYWLSSQSYVVIGTQGEVGDVLLGYYENGGSRLSGGDSLEWDPLRGVWVWNEDLGYFWTCEMIYPWTYILNMQEWIIISYINSNF